MVSPNRTMMDQYLELEVSKRVAQVDNTVKLGKYCLEKVKRNMLVLTTVTTDELVMNSTLAIDHQAICGYIELYGHEAHVVNFNKQQLGIEIRWKVPHE